MSQMTQEENKAWADVVIELEAAGVRPSDVRKEILKRKEKSEGLFGWAGDAVSQPITWKGVLMLALGVMLFAGLLKLIGMAFNVNVPLLHTATPALPA